MATALPRIKQDLLTNKAYGFPTRGAKRRIKPTALACIHITDNPKNQGANAAQNERDYANRGQSMGPSAHFYVNRDGSGIKAIDWINFAAWSNGDLSKPFVQNNGIATIVKKHNQGYNANECFAVEVENVGFAKVSGQLTTAQKRRCARLIARASIQFGLPINRDTVLPHAYINTIDRQNCPALPKLRDALLDDIVLRAKRQKKRMIARGVKPV